MVKRLGILSREENNRFPFGKQTHFYEEMIMESRDLAIEVFFFDPSRWKRSSLLIDGYKFKGKWIASVEPIPSIIYDRYLLNSSVNRHVAEEFRTFLVRKGCKFTTAPELAELIRNKLDFKDFLLRNHYPTLDAVLLADLSFNLLDGYLKYNPAVYIKPIAGAKGKGVALLEYKNGSFILKQRLVEKVIGESQVICRLREEFDGSSYMAQPKAKVIDIDNSPFDVRVLIQNRGNNNYFITGIGVRVGEKNSLVSNINANGRALPVSSIVDFYNSYYRNCFDSTIKRLEDICLDCAHQLHSMYGDFVEIAFDVLLTTDKGPLILEANSMPGRWMFNLIAESLRDFPAQRSEFVKLRKLSVRLPLVFVSNQNYDL